MELPEEKPCSPGERIVQRKRPTIYRVVEPNARGQVFNSEANTGHGSPSRVNALTMGKLHPRRM